LRKARTFNPSLYTSPIAVDLEDGGTIGVYPMDFDKAEEYTEVVFRTEIERDDTGSIIYNSKTGDPSRKYAATTADELTYARKQLAYVANLRDEEGNPIGTTQKYGDASVCGLHTSSEQDLPAIDAFLKELNNSEIPLDADGKEFIGRKDQVKAADAPKVKGKSLPATKTVEEPIYKRVIRESSRLRREINERLRKNSLPTQ
jgi:hypothetical protein